MDAIDLGEGAPPLDPHVSGAASGPFADPDPVADDPATPESAEPSTPMAAAPNEPAAAPSFEIDHGVDPEWGVGGRGRSVPMAESPAEPPAGVDDGAVWDLGSVDDTPSPTLDPVVPPTNEPAPQPESVDAGLPRLTDAVQDRDLFEGSGLDVARLAAGEEREIVVPLEVQEADRTVQRFKLSIRLRMEPID